MSIPDINIPDINDSNVFSSNFVYKREDDWMEAPCYAKIFTHPTTGIADRIDFINKVVDKLNYCMTRLSLMKEPDVERNIDVVEIIKQKVLPLYKDLIKKNCFPQDDAKIDPDILDIYIRYLLSLGGKKMFYPADGIKKINGKNTIMYLSMKLPSSLKDALYAEAKSRKVSIQQLPPRPDDHQKSYDHSSSGYSKWMTLLGGKVRSAKHHPHRKSSATKRHPRRKSSAIKHRRRRTSRK